MAHTFNLRISGGVVRPGTKPVEAVLMCCGKPAPRLDPTSKCVFPPDFQRKDTVKGVAAVFEVAVLDVGARARPEGCRLSPWLNWSSAAF